MDRLAVFGFLSAFAALACWMEQDRSAGIRLMFGACLAALAVYGFLAGAWPLGLVLSFASVGAIGRSYARRFATRSLRASPASARRIGPMTSSQIRSSLSDGDFHGTKHPGFPIGPRPGIN
jgi:hypothetical protein